MIDERLRSAADELLHELELTVPPTLPVPRSRSVVVVAGTALVAAATVVGLIAVTTNGGSDPAADGSPDTVVDSTVQSTEAPELGGATLPMVLPTLPSETVPAGALLTISAPVLPTSVRVYNASTVNGAAGSLTTRLANASYSVEKASNASAVVDVTEIYFAADFHDQALTLSLELGGARISPIASAPTEDDPPAAGTALTILIGEDLAHRILDGSAAATSTTVPGSRFSSPDEQTVVKVYNASTTNGAAGMLTTQLAGAGYVAETASNALERSDRTAVFFADGFEARAQTLAIELGGATTAPIASAPGFGDPYDPGTSLLIFLGTDLAPDIGPVPT